MQSLSKAHCPLSFFSRLSFAVRCPRRVALPLALCLLSLFCTLAPFSVMATETAAEQTKGRASWYGTTAHGKQTASGEIYNRNALTAAHKQLPFGSVVRVRNLKNGRHVLVRINDRGPFVRGRVVDVSLRAAEALRMTKSGVVPVSLELVGNTGGEPLKKDNAFFVRLADVAGAMKARDRMTALGNKLKMPLRAILHKRNGKQAFAVCSGPYATFQEAHRAFSSFERKSIDVKDIIEGPLAEDTFSLHIAEASEIALSVSGVEPSQYVLSTIDALAAVLKNVSHIVPGLPFQSGVLALSIVREGLPYISSDMPFFTLPYQGHSGYTYFPS